VNHHYLPQFYLRAWAGADGRVLRYTRVSHGRVVERPVGTRGTAFEPGLYATPPALHWESYDPNIIETQFMSPVDNDAAPVHAKLVAGATALAESERTAWALFLNSLIHRHHDGILERDAAAPGAAAAVTANLLARYMDAEDRARVIETLRDADLEQMARTAHRTVMVQRIRDPDALAAITAQAWTVVVIDPAAPPLITTDRPLLVNLGKGGFPTLMTLPLSPMRLFVAYAPDPALGGADPSIPSLLENLALANDLLLLNEQPCRYVYASRKVDDEGAVGSKVLRLRTAVEQALVRWGEASVTPMAPPRPS
jgi:hypothetical protein